MKNAYFFSHDSNARTDPKIMAMLLDYKCQGYGLYWTIVEILSEQSDYQLKSNKITYNAIAMAMLSDAITIEKFVNDCIYEYELFSSDEEYFWSDSLVRRMEMKEENRRKKSEAGKKGAESRWNNGSAMAMPSEIMANDGKGKERKGKERKETKGKESIGEESKTELSSSESSAIKSFQENIHMASPIEFEKLMHWMEDVSPEVVIGAVEEAVNYNKRSMGYINAVLNSWLKIGITTKEALDAFKRDKADEKNKSNNSDGSVIHPNVKQALDLVKKYEDMEREQGDDS